MKVNGFTEKVLILGTKPLAWKIAEVMGKFSFRYSVVGLVDNAFNCGGVIPRNGAVIYYDGKILHSNGEPHPDNAGVLPGNGGTLPSNSETHSESGKVLPGNGEVPPCNGSALPHNGNVLPGNGKDLPHKGTGAHPPASGFPIIGPIDRLENTIKDLQPDRIIVPLTEDGKIPVQALLNSRIEGVVVEDGDEVYERLTQKLAIESLPPNLLIFSKDLRKTKFQMALRRTFSLSFAAIGLVLTAPLMAFIALAIKLESKGAVLFFHERAGLKGKPFRLIKFRTMIPSTGKTPEWLKDNSDRITALGKWLRKSRLDEIPQFINILRGDMDFVGPRPLPYSNLSLLLDKIPYYSFRTVIRPGVTGWAQVCFGYADDVEEETEKMRYDLYYIKHMSLWFDLRIIFNTLKTLLFGRGSEAADG